MKPSNPKEHKITDQIFKSARLRRIQTIQVHQQKHSSYQPESTYYNCPAELLPPRWCMMMQNAEHQPTSQMKTAYRLDKLENTQL